MRKILKLIRKVMILLIILGIIGSGLFYYNKYRKEKERRLAEEEKKRQEEIEKEKKRKLIEEKKKLFEKYISEIEKYYKEEKNYKKVEELAKEAIAIAKQYNFPSDRIYKILHQIEVDRYLIKLEQLQKENQDIYKFFYVRSELQKIPSLKEIYELKNNIINQTYENEYKVKLISAKKALDNLAEGDQPTYNYFLSKKLYYEARNLRAIKNIKKDKMEEEIEKLQNELYFASKHLFKNTIPTSIYY
ncbi:MAG: hypothetical protein NC915_02505 [Candidatus Omnitrophica bacterium]|nr:hypothetical protein [Candidatus Omnitrophota bacterium]